MSAYHMGQDRRPKILHSAIHSRNSVTPLAQRSKYPAAKVMFNRPSKPSSQRQKPEMVMYLLSTESTETGESYRRLSIILGNLLWVTHQILKFIIAPRREGPVCSPLDSMLTNTNYLTVSLTVVGEVATLTVEVEALRLLKLGKGSVLLGWILGDLSSCSEENGCNILEVFPKVDFDNHGDLLHVLRRNLSKGILDII